MVANLPEPNGRVDSKLREDRPVNHVRRLALAFVAIDRLAALGDLLLVGHGDPAPTVQALVGSQRSPRSFFARDDVAAAREHLPVGRLVDQARHRAACGSMEMR